MSDNRSCRRIQSLLVFSLLGVLALAPAAPAQASSVVTDCTESGLDAALASGGLITFNCANTHAPATISFNFPKTISVTTSIDGSNGGHTVIIDSVGSTRLFSVTTGVQLALLNLVLENGFDSDGGCLYTNGALVLNNLEATNCVAATGTSGGVLYVSKTGSAALVNANLHDNLAYSAGGGMYSLGVLTVTGSTLAHNAAINNYGGGVCASGRTVIAGSTIYSNTASMGYGGGLYNEGTLTLTDSALTDNYASGAGGLHSHLGTSDLRHVTLSGNSAQYAGGGIENYDGNMALTDVTLSGNSASTLGGGLYGHSQGTTSLISVTVSDNSAGDDAGLSNASGRMALTNVTLAGNRADTNGGLGNGGTLTATNLTLVGNHAGDIGGLGNSGQANLTNVTVISNTASNFGGIENSGAMTLTNATLSFNSALGYGGGLVNAGTATLTNATLRGNSAARGGGIDNQHGSLTLTHTTLSGNSATTSGGGIYNEYPGRVTLTLATLSGNSAQTGGGIENYAGITALTNVTIGGNSASSLGGGLYQYGVAPDQHITFTNTVVAAGPTGANCYVDPTSVNLIASHGFNLSSDSSCAPYLNVAGDVNSANPHLGPLANNGGPTLTHLPAASSPAIDAIPLSVNGCGTTLTTDQRGAPRPINGKCDIGAVEAAWPYPRLWLPLVRR